MNQEVANLYPKSVWTFFESLNAVPRPSKLEERVREFMIQFAKDNHLDFLVDPAGNVIIKKNGSAGKENDTPVILQSHLDMVHQKNNDTQFDFLTQGIESYIDGDWVTAKGTTLGADNGMGVAAIMSVLADKTLVHPPLEALFTVDEETGMGGAFGLEAGYLKGKTLLNLDSEDEGELYVGCSGGVDTNITFPINYQSANNVKSYSLSITGLKGGHSGMDIHLGRGNAIKIAARILFELTKNANVSLISFEGGSLRNAIPREAFVKFSVEPNTSVDAIVESVVAEIKSELSFAEPHLKVEWSSADYTGTTLGSPLTKKIINVLYAAPNGALRMSDTIKNLTETSTNLALFRLNPSEAEVQFLSRSLIVSAQKSVCNQIEACFASIENVKIEHTGEYPGWTPNPNSKVLSVFKETYKEKFGIEPPVKAIHAGLECGILAINYPDLDMISFGPTIRDPHSPDEKVHIKSVGKFYDYLVAALAKL
jgi:dipeptidase D